MSRYVGLRRLMTSAAKLQAPKGKDIPDVVPSVMLESGVTGAPSRIRAVFFGFLAGLSTAMGTGFYLMRGEIQQSSAALRTNVDVIGEGVFTVAENLKKIDLLTLELTRLKKDVARNEDLQELKTALQKERDELSIQLSEHKARVNTQQKELYEVIEQLRSTR
jgi:hypothetical protein